METIFRNGIQRSYRYSCDFLDINGVISTPQSDSDAYRILAVRIPIPELKQQSVLYGPFANYFLTMEQENAYTFEMDVLETEGNNIRKFIENQLAEVVNPDGTHNRPSEYKTKHPTIELTIKDDTNSKQMAITFSQWHLLSATPTTLAYGTNEAVKYTLNFVYQFYTIS